MVIMSEKIRDMEDRFRKPNMKVMGVQKETKEQFGKNNQIYFRRKIICPKKLLVFFIS